MDTQLSPAAPAAGSTRNPRRAFLTTAALTAAAAAFAPAALAVTPALTFADIPGSGDVKALNYALALEDLEADLYSQAIKRLTGGGINALGVKIKGLGVGGDQPDVRFTQSFGKVEAEHRDFIRGALTGLGATVIPQFKYDFKIQSLNRKQVGDLLYLAESTGVRAYLGAIPFFESANSPYLQIAAAIQGTEARHTAVFAAVLNVLFRTGLSVAPLANQDNGIDTPLAPDKVLAAVSPFIVV